MRTHCLCILAIVSISLFDTIKAQNKQLVDSLSILVEKVSTPDTTKIKAYNDLGVQYAISDFNTALAYTRKALSIAKRINAPRGVAGAYNCMGIVHYYSKKYDSALVCYQRAFDINKQLNHTWGQASASHQIGAVYNAKEDYKNAIQYFKKSGDIFLNQKDTVSYAKSVENIGISHFWMGNQEKGIDFFIKAIKLYEASNNKDGISRGYINLGSMLIKQKAYKKGLTYLHDALPTVKKNGNKLLLCFTLYKIGLCYKELKVFDKAEHYFLEAITLAKELRRNKKIAYYQYLLAEVYYEKEEYNKSLSYLINSKKRDTTNTYCLAHNYNLSAKCNLQLCDIKKAKGEALLSLKLASKLHDEEGIKEANLTLASIAEKQGKNKEALQYYKSFLKLKDSLQLKEDKAYVMKLETMYEAEKKEQKIELQDCTISTLKERWKESIINNIIFLIGLLVAIAVIIFMVLFTRKNIKINELEKIKLTSELDSKQKQLTYQTLQITKKNKLLQILKERLEELKDSREDIRNNITVYQKLIHAINFDITDDKSWEYFKTHFEQLHHDFYKRMRIQFPEITTNEIRLLALLKLNLSSQEIAVILNITKGGVKKAKYRLRKKLAIDSQGQLEELVLAI